MALTTTLCLLLASVLGAVGFQRDFLCRYYLKGQCRYSCQSSQGELTVRYPLLCFPGTFCCIASTVSQTTTPTTTTTTPAPAVYTGCGVGQASTYAGAVTSRIIGGVQAGQCEFPWMVHFQRPYSPCGGALIDNRHVLTAAHCVTQLGSGTLNLTIGEYNTSKSEPFYERKLTSADYTLYYPENFNSFTYENDIAIVKLREPLSTLGCVSPICLPPRDLRFPQGTACTVAGWGQTYTWSGILSDVLMKVQIPIVDEGVCVDLFSPLYFKNATNYCAGYLPGGRDSCGGDSGGPLMCLRDGVYVAAGIVSAGMDCAQVNRPAIYTDVAQYLDWIDRVRRLP